MPLQISLDMSGLEPKTLSAFDDIIAAIQTWANQVDGVNASERLAALTSGVAALPTVPTGLISAWPTASAPTGYLLCNGAAVSRTTYSTLFAIVGGAYGAGDGSSTFNVPDLRGRFILGTAVSGTGSTLTGTGGTIDHTHTVGSHTHSISSAGSHSHGGNTGASSSGVVIAHTTTPVNADTNGDGSTTTVGGWVSGNVVDDGVQTHPIGSDGGHDHGGATGSSGSGTSSTGNPPFMALTYIIKT